MIRAARLQVLPIALIALSLSVVNDAFAEIDSQNLFDGVLDAYESRAAGWQTVIVRHASWLFWTLVVISMVWTFGMMALRKADLGEFFSEMVRFTIFVGFFWWLLINGPHFADTIIRSLRQVGSEASGLGTTLHPGQVTDIGFSIFFKIIDNTSVWSPVTSALGAVLGLGILIIIALVSANMLILLCASWILLYAGVFFLGFGGSRWTSDIAVNYYRTVLALGASLFTMVLIVGIGASIIEAYYTNMSQEVRLKELTVIFIVAVILLLLVDKVPSMVAGIINGPRSAGVGNVLTAGSAVGMIGMATAAVSTGGATALAGVRAAAGGASAVHAAYQQAQHHMAAGAGLFTTSGNGSSNAGEVSRFASAMNTGVKLAADTGVNLARGVGQVAKDKMSAVADGFAQATHETFGGQVAVAIKSRGQLERRQDTTPPFGKNSLAAGKTPTEKPDNKTDSTASTVPVEPRSEVDDFVNKKPSV